MQYQRICALVGAEQADVAAALLGAAGFGVEVIDDQTIEKPPPGRIGVVVWAELADAERALAEVRGILARAGVTAEVQTRNADEADWRDAWKAYFKPRPIGRFVLVPSWERWDTRAGETMIALDPGRAFGTGGHPSTRLCLRALGDLPGCGRFLDLGCGSGVLAIACALLWPDAHGVALDVLPEAAEVSRANARVNWVADRIDASTRSLDEVPGPFDVICANIQADVIGPLGAALATRLAPAGTLIASGLLAVECDALAAELSRHGLAVRTTLDEEEWRALVLRHAESA